MKKSLFAALVITVALALGVIPFARAIETEPILTLSIEKGTGQPAAVSPITTLKLPAGVIKTLAKEGRIAFLAHKGTTYVVVPYKLTGADERLDAGTTVLFRRIGSLALEYTSDAGLVPTTRSPTGTLITAGIYESTKQYLIVTYVDTPGVEKTATTTITTKEKGSEDVQVAQRHVLTFLSKYEYPTSAATVGKADDGTYSDVAKKADEGSEASFTQYVVVPDTPADALGKTITVAQQGADKDTLRTGLMVYTVVPLELDAGIPGDTLKRTTDVAKDIGEDPAHARLIQYVVVTIDGPRIATSGLLKKSTDVVITGTPGAALRTGQGSQFLTQYYVVASLEADIPADVADKTIGDETLDVAKETGEDLTHTGLMEQYAVVSLDTDTPADALLWKATTVTKEASEAVAQAGFTQYVQYVIVPLDISVLAEGEGGRMTGFEFSNGLYLLATYQVMAFDIGAEGTEKKADIGPQSGMEIAVADLTFVREVALYGSEISP